MISTTIRPTVDIDVVAAVELLDVQIPSANALAILNDTATASGIERGIVAAGVIERMVPAGVEMEEHNLGTGRRTRGVYLHQAGDEHMAMNFLDRTHEIGLHIDSHDPEEEFDGFVTPAELFEKIRAYYRL